MRVYSRVVIDMASGAVMAAVGEDYAGPVAECKSSGGSTVNSYDPDYNAGLLLLQQAEEGRSQELYNQFVYGVTYNPNEVVYTDAAGKVYTEDEVKASREAQAGNVVGDYNYQKQVESLMQLGSTEEDAKKVLANAGVYPQSSVTDTTDFQQTTRGALEGYDPNAQTSEMQYLQNLVQANQSLLAGETSLAAEQTGLERAQVASSLNLLPAQERLQATQLATETQLTGERAGLESTQIAAANSLIDPTTQLALSKIEAEASLLPQQTGVASARLSDELTAIQGRAPVRAEFYNQALNGVDVAQRQNQAQAGVEHAFANTQREFDKTLQSSGLKPGDAGYTDALNQRLLAKVKGISGARSQARTLAESEIFNRLQAATAVTG